MKSRIFIIFLTVLLISCGGNNKQVKLEKLKKQRDKLNEQITKLQDEILKSGQKLNEEEILNVGVRQIAPTTFNHYIEVQGKIDGDDNVNVSPKNIGVVKSILVKQGDVVRKDQVLGEMDDQVLQRGLQELYNSLSFATDLYNKQKNLWDQRIGSEVQYLTAKNQKEAAEKRIATMKDQIDMMKIKSPINGTVEDIPIKIGQNMAPGLTAFRVINFSSIKAVAEVAEAYSSKIKSGDSALVYLPDLNKEIHAKIDFSSKYINPANRTFIVEIHLNPNEPNLRVNMISVLKINDYQNSSAVVVPVNVVQNTQQGKYVFIAKEENNKMVAKKAAIIEGLIYNGTCEIKSGLASGDRVIISGYQDLQEGQLIKF